MWVGGQRHAPAALPPGKTRYSTYRRLGGPQGQSERVWNISPEPGFDPRTVQPVASRYTDWAIPAYITLYYVGNVVRLSHRCGLTRHFPGIWCLVTGRFLPDVSAQRDGIASKIRMSTEDQQPSDAVKYSRRTDNSIPQFYPHPLALWFAPDKHIWCWSTIWMWKATATVGLTRVSVHVTRGRLEETGWHEATECSQVLMACETDTDSVLRVKMLWNRETYTETQNETMFISAANCIN